MVELLIQCTLKNVFGVILTETMPYRQQCDIANAYFQLWKTEAHTHR